MSAVRAVHLVSSTDRRGAQVFASQLVEALGGGPGHHLVAVAPGRTGGLDVPTLGGRRADPAGLARLVRLVRGAQVLVAHGSSALLHGALASAAARRPFVYRNIGDPAAWGSVRGADLRIGAPLRRAAGVAAVYEGARGHLVRTYRLDPARVRTIPTGVPDRPGPSSGERERARVELGLDPALRWVAFVGALSAEKGVAAAVDAVAADAGLGLVVAGDGPEAAAARHSAGRVAPGRVRFLGSVPDPWTVMAAAEVLVLPSRTEGVPAVAIEAGLAGLPVVGTRVGGIPEVVEDGTTGVLVDDTRPATLAAALRRALDDAASLGGAAQRRCTERFTMEPVARAWARLLEDVVSGRLS